MAIIGESHRQPGEKLAENRRNVSLGSVWLKMAAEEESESYSA